jgi:hypothetical protein
MKILSDKKIMSTTSYPPENTLISNNSSDSLESSINDSLTQVDPLSTLLPRSAWNSQLTYLRVLFRAKKALDRIEQVGTLRS